MKKFFTKKESELICSLLFSRDVDNVKMGISLILTHPRYKSISNTIIVRYKHTWLIKRGWIACITEKRKASEYLKLTQRFTSNSTKLFSEDRYIITTIKEFVEKRTFKSK